MRTHVDVVMATDPELVAQTADAAAAELVEDSAPIGGTDGGAESAPRTTTPRSGKKETNR